MNTSAVVTASLIPRLSLQESSQSRSQTQPRIESSETSYESRLSVDGSPRQPAPERDNSFALPSPTRPQMKKRSTTLTSLPARKAHSKNDSALSKSPSVPSFHLSPDPQESKSALPILTPESPSVTPAPPLLPAPSSTSTSDNRSASQKRAPASHSSYGVETSNGPPPSFTTQRTLSQDRLWKPSPPEKSHVAQKSNAGTFYEAFEYPPTDMGEAINDQEVDSSQEELDTIDTSKKRLDEPVEGRDIDADPVMAGHSTETLCNNREQPGMRLDLTPPEGGSKDSGSDDRKSEDVFLNIAQTDAGGQELMTRSRRRKSRSGTFYVSSVSKSSNNHPSEAITLEQQDHINDGTPSPHIGVPYQPNKRQSFGRRSIAASAHPLDDTGRQRYFSTGTRNNIIGTQRTVETSDRETSPELLYNTSHRGQNTDPGTRSYCRSNRRALRSHRNVSASEVQEQSGYADQNATRVEGTDSTLSTAAPSTVWDELDELKSRIKKLELTGKLPSSSAAAMSTTERPRTATTTVTTMSSSPNQGKASISPNASSVGGVSATVHPLLHEALRKARPVLSADIYQKLETTASDALQLASVMGAGLHPGSASTIGGSSSAERQLRRRADSMCRGLTELTIALSAGPRPSTVLQPFRPSSRDASSTFAHTTPPTTSCSVDSASRFGSRFSNDPDDAHSSAVARIQSRLQARRASLLHNSILSSPQEYSSPEITVHTPSSGRSQTQPTSSNRLNRAATRLRGRRPAGTAEGAEDPENDESPSVRPVSRARTDIGLRYRSARDRTSLGREYTSSHPLPSLVWKGNDSAAERSPSVIASSGLPTRRSYASSNANGGSSNLNSPATPRDNIQPGYRRYVSSGAAKGYSPYLSSTEQTPESVKVQRGSAPGSRRSIGLADRLGQVGSFVNGRLRAAKIERKRQEDLQTQQKAPTLPLTHQQSGEDQENEAVY